MNDSTAQASGTPRRAWQAYAHLACAIVGTGLLTAGVALIYRPAGFIVPGVLLLAGAVAGALRSGP
jgi:hypothetical protein